MCRFFGRYSFYHCILQDFMMRTDHCYIERCGSMKCRRTLGYQNAFQRCKNRIITRECVRLVYLSYIKAFWTWLWRGKMTFALFWKMPTRKIVWGICQNCIFTKYLDMNWCSLAKVCGINETKPVPTLVVYPTPTSIIPMMPGLIKEN